MRPSISWLWTRLQTPRAKGDASRRLCLMTSGNGNAKLCAAFRKFKNRDVYWNTIVQKKRYLRSRTSRPVLYQRLETCTLVPEWFKRAFCVLPVF